MRSRRLWGSVAVVVIAVFVFVPFLPTVTRNAYSGSQGVGWVSPSFVFFQCGAATGGYSLMVPGGGGVGGLGTVLGVELGLELRVPSPLRFVRWFILAGAMNPDGPSDIRSTQKE